MPLSISGSFLLKTPSTIAVAVVWQEADVVALFVGAAQLCSAALRTAGSGKAGVRAGVREAGFTCDGCSSNKQPEVGSLFVAGALGMAGKAVCLCRSRGLSETGAGVAAT